MQCHAYNIIIMSCTIGSARAFQSFTEHVLHVSNKVYSYYQYVSQIWLIILIMQ